MTEGIHTGDLESIHSLYIKYVPKRKMFSVEGMQARLRLAALDNNHHVDRQQATTRNGELRFKLQYSKPAGTYIAKPIKVAKTYDFRTELLCGVVQRCHATTRVHHQPAASIETDSTVARVTLGERAGIHKPTKKEAIDQYVSRFKKNNWINNGESLLSSPSMPESWRSLGYTNGCSSRNLSQRSPVQSRAAGIITINAWIVTVVGVHKRMFESQPFSTESCSESRRCYHHHQCLNRDGRWGTQTDVRVTTFLNGVLFRVAPLLSSPSMPESWRSLGYTNGCSSHNLSQRSPVQSRAAVIITINAWIVTVVGVHKRMFESQPFSTESCSESRRCYHHHQCLNRDGRCL